MSEIQKLVSPPHVMEKHIFFISIIIIIIIYFCCLYRLSMDSEMLCCSIWYEWVLHPVSHKICKNNAITLTVSKVPGVNVLVKTEFKKTNKTKKGQPI